MCATDRRLLALAALAFVALPAASHAQIQASERFTLTQTVDSVDITIAGARPSARGRTIYGDVVPWGHSWVAGARIPTTLEIGRDFSINDTAVPAGKYTMWVMPRQEEPWLLILDPREDLNHGSDPDSAAAPGQYFAHLDVSEIDPVETLTWSINDIRGYGSRVRMEWGDRRVEFTLRLKSTYTIAVNADRAAGLVGRYALTVTDTTETPWVSHATISHENGLLRIRYTIPPEAEAKYEGITEYYANHVEILVPRAEDLFLTGEAFEGELVQLAPWEIWEFSREGGVATGFEVRRTRSDELQVTGTRVP